MASITLANARNLQSDQVRASRIFDATPRVFDMLPDLPWMPVSGEALVVNEAAKDVDSPSAPNTAGRGIVIASASADPGTDFTQTVPTDYTAALDAYDPTTRSYYIRELG